MFQGFKGQTFQAISAHASRGAVKGPELAKLVLEATTLLERSGFYVDAVVSDAANWNRNMWGQFGIKKRPFEREAGPRGEIDDDCEDLLDENFGEDLLAYLNPSQCNSKNKKTATKKKRTIRKPRTKKNPPPLQSKVAPQRLNSSAAKFSVGCVHPLDNKRRLYFFSDFPHLIKSIKQRILKEEILEVKINSTEFFFKS
jgi:hypothetical protein